jgi:hypothetical protein
VETRESSAQVERNQARAEPMPTGLPPLPTGPAAAAILSAAAYIFVLGLLTFVAAAAEGAKDWLAFQNRVGPLSGKTTLAGVVWIVVWPGLYLLWRKRDVPLTAVLVLAAALILVGSLFMFPPIFEAVEP